MPGSLIANERHDRGNRSAGSRGRTPLRVWWLVAGLFIMAFLARGPLYLSVFPPFEGWDEYQHLAYIVHLDETGALPLYESRVSLALRPLVVAMPHSPSGAEQVREWGALPGRSAPAASLESSASIATAGPSKKAGGRIVILAFAATLEREI